MAKQTRRIFKAQLVVSDKDSDDRESEFIKSLKVGDTLDFEASFTKGRKA